MMDSSVMAAAAVTVTGTQSDQMTRDSDAWPSLATVESRATCYLSPPPVSEFSILGPTNPCNHSSSCGSDSDSDLASRAPSAPAPQAAPANPEHRPPTGT